MAIEISISIIVLLICVLFLLFPIRFQKSSDGKIIIITSDERHKLTTLIVYGVINITLVILFANIASNYRGFDIIYIVLTYLLFALPLFKSFVSSLKNFSRKDD